jgi:hypothetical protein
MKGESIRCGVCPTIFVKKMRSQLYCSRECYVKAWPINNREKAADKSRLRRLANPDWYAAREKGYSQSSKNKVLEKRPWRYIFKSRQMDAKKRGLPFSLTDAWCATRWTGCCELTGLAFVKNPSGKGPHPFSCTIDKINPGLGYIPENSRFILHAVNCMKGSGSDEDVYAIAKALIAKFSHKDSSPARAALG